MNSELKISIVSGGAGFIGTNLIKKLLNENRHVVILDNMIRGSQSNLALYNLDSNPNVTVIVCDCSDPLQIEIASLKLLELGIPDELWHLAANSDIPAGVDDPAIDLKHTFMTTFHLLSLMKKCEITTLHFASSSAIYGDHGEALLKENTGPYLPISNYGAMKLASEALISSASESFLKRVNIFRFPNVVGVPATHGVILDFIKKLNFNKTRLEVLGDGTQMKSYLHVSDLLEAMFLIRNLDLIGKIQVLNVGPIDTGVTVSWIAKKVVERINPKAKIIYGSGNKGWVGDVPKFSYSTDLIQSYGWRPKLNSAESIILAIQEIDAAFIGSP